MAKCSKLQVSRPSIASLMPPVTPADAAPLPALGTPQRDPPPARNRAALSTLWQQTFGRPLPTRLSLTLAADALAYERQVQAARGLSRAAERALARLLEPPDAAPSARSTRPRRFKPGTRLLRTWQGRTHTVTVADPGFIYAGRTYRSLSVIAREITGTSWSGPAFFGLQRRARKLAHG